MKKKISILLMILCTSLLCACSNNKDNVQSNVSDTLQVTTQETITTKEVNTEYEVRGNVIYLSIASKDKFDGLVLKKGDIIFLNDIVSKEASDIVRGAVASDIITTLYPIAEYPDVIQQFRDTYIKPGTNLLEISYDQNVCLEYLGEKQFMFHFIEYFSEFDEAAFDVYEIN